VHLDQLAKFIRLAGFAFANNFGVRLKEADNLFRKLRHSSKQARSGLPHHIALRQKVR
jgi:hypothetical protein